MAKEKVNIFYVRWYPKDFLASVASFSPEEEGIYRKFLDFQAINNFLPMEMEALTNISRYDSERFAKFWITVSKKFSPYFIDKKQVGFYNKRMALELEKVRDKSKVNSKIAKNRQEAIRKAKNEALRTDCERTANAPANAPANALRTDCHTIVNSQYTLNNKEEYKGGQNCVPPVVDFLDQLEAEVDARNAAKVAAVAPVEKPVKAKKEKSVFVPPTREEVFAYAVERGFGANAGTAAGRYCDFFESGDWKDSNYKQVHSWKQKFVTWEGFGLKDLKPNAAEKNIIADKNYPPGVTLEMVRNAKIKTELPENLYKSHFQGWYRLADGNYQQKEVKITA